MTPFASPVTNRFAAVQWRVGEIAAPGRAGFVAGQPWRYELEPRWISGELNESKLSFELPAKTCQEARTYRVRARYKDHTGRWSHWSAPIEFTPNQRSN